MRVKIKCKLLVENPTISYNYKEKLRSFVYQSLTKYDSKYAKELHDNQSISEFSYSKLNFRKYTKSKTHLTINDESFDFTLSSFNIKVINSIKNAVDVIYDFGNGFIFKVIGVSDVEVEEVNSDTVFYSEFFVTKKINTVKNSIMSYLPDEDGFSHAFFNNLIKKYQNLTNDNKLFDVSKMRIDFIHLNNTNAPSGLEQCFNYNIKYFKLKFKLICDVELIKVAYVNGVGEKNNSGFGFVEIFKK